MEKQRLQLKFKGLIKPDEISRGLSKIKKKPDYVCDLVVHEPKNIEEARLGTIFMLGRIENIPKKKYRNFDFLLTLLFSVIKRELYSDHKRPAQESLEAALNKANLYLADFTEKGNSEWIGNLTFICGVFCDNTLHVSKIGNGIVKLFRENSVSHIENKFPNQNKKYPLKTFGNVASGTILPLDKIIIGTKNILNYVPVNLLKQLIKLDYQKITEKIDKTIESQEFNAPILGLVLESKQALEEKIEYTKSLLPAIKKSKLKALTGLIFNIIKKIFIIVFVGTKKILRLFWYLIKKIYQLLIFVLKKILTPTITKKFERLSLVVINKCRPYTKKIIIIFKTIKNSSKNIYNTFKIKKPALIIVICLTMLLLTLPFFVTQKINYHHSLNDFDCLSAKIKTAQKKVETVLIYQDHKNARALLEKNQELIDEISKYLENSLLENNQQIITQVNKFKITHQQQKDSVGNVIRTENLKEILDFSKTGFIVHPARMIIIDQELYFYEMDSGILYKFSIGAEEKDIVLIFISAKDELRNMTLLENNKIVLLGQSGKTYIYDANTNEHKVYLCEPSFSIEKIKEIKGFYSNFYILDLEQKNIIKYSLNQVNEKNILIGYNWLENSLEQQDNIYDIAIDGSIYILYSDKIVEYFGGKKTKEISLNLDKSLGKETKLFIQKDYKNFYVADPENNRLIVLNSQGEILNQYVNKNFSELKSFWITKNEKIAYLLCGKKIYKLDF